MIRVELGFASFVFGAFFVFASTGVGSRNTKQKCVKTQKESRENRPSRRGRPSSLRSSSSFTLDLDVLDRAVDTGDTVGLEIDLCRGSVQGCPPRPTRAEDQRGRGVLRPRPRPEVEVAAARPRITCPSPGWGRPRGNAGRHRTGRRGQAAARSLPSAAAPRRTRRCRPRRRGCSRSCA